MGDDANSSIDIDFQSFKKDILNELNVVIPQIVNTEIDKNITLKQAQKEDKQAQKEDLTRHAIIFQPKTGEETFSKQSFSEMVKKDLPTMTILTKQGKGFMTFPDKNSRYLAAQALQDNCKVAIQDDRKKPLYPKL